MSEAKINYILRSTLLTEFLIETTPEEIYRLIPGNWIEWKMKDLISYMEKKVKTSHELEWGRIC